MYIQHNRAPMTQPLHLTAVDRAIHPYHHITSTMNGVPAPPDPSFAVFVVLILYVILSMLCVLQKNSDPISF